MDPKVPESKAQPAFVETSAGKDVEKIVLSSYTKAYLKNFLAIKPKLAPDEVSRISVSQTVSFFALAYERVRNAVEYREAHLIRRAVDSGQGRLDFII